VSALLLLPRSAKNHRGAAATVKWNPLDKDSSVTLSVGNTVATFPTADRNVRGDVGRSSGKYYFRLRNSGSGAATAAAGIGNASASLTVRPGLSDANSWAHQSNANKLHSGFSAYGANWDGINQELMVAVDLTAGTMWFGVSGTWMASGDPATGANPSFTGITAGTYYPIGCSPIGSSKTLTFIVDTPPSGFTYW